MVFWFLLHGAVLLSLFLDNTELKIEVDSSKHGHVQAIMYFVTMVVTGALFVRTSTINPGWLKRPIDEVEIKTEPGASVGMKTTKKEEEPVDPTCRFCPACNIWQKLRSKHCNLCNRCVAKYDHHCFWMGNCIGEKNHGMFWWFLFFESSLIVWSIVLIVQGLVDTEVDSVQDFLEHNLFPCVVVIGIFVVGWLPMALLGLHSWLIITNQTTWEFNRRSRITYLHHLPDGVHPFSMGCAGNVDLICCDFDAAPRSWRAVANLVGKI